MEQMIRVTTWPNVAWVIGENGPVWVFIENVPNHLNHGFREVRGELESLGYGVANGFSALEEVDAPHRMQRLFVLARRLYDPERYTLRFEQE